MAELKPPYNPPYPTGSVYEGKIKHALYTTTKFNDFVLEVIKIGDGISYAWQFDSINDKIKEEFKKNPDIFIDKFLANYSHMLDKATIKKIQMLKVVDKL